NLDMKIAAAKAIAGTIRAEDVAAEYIVPSVFDRRVAPAVAKAVDEAAIRTGVARKAAPPPQAG
ncbi:MAG: NAD-dependent malic enzyme, partial [Planctomycetota bacterium]